MPLVMTGEFALQVQDLKPDTAVPGSKMQAAVIVVGNLITPCIIRSIARGNIEKNNSAPAANVALLVSKRVRRTAHTKKGYVDVQIATKWVQFSVYIHADHLETFFKACIAAILMGRTL